MEFTVWPGNTGTRGHRDGRMELGVQGVSVRIKKGIYHGRYGLGLACWFGRLLPCYDYSTCLLRAGWPISEFGNGSWRRIIDDSFLCLHTQSITAVVLMAALPSTFLGL